VAFHVPVPQADPKALAWMQAEVSAAAAEAGHTQQADEFGQKTDRKRNFGTLRILAIRKWSQKTDTTSAADILTGGGKTQLGSRRREWRHGQYGGWWKSRRRKAVLRAARQLRAATPAVEHSQRPRVTPMGIPAERRAHPRQPPKIRQPLTAIRQILRRPLGLTAPALLAMALPLRPIPNAKPADSTADPQKESTSKKKKGLKKNHSLVIFRRS